MKDFEIFKEIVETWLGDTGLHVPDSPDYLPLHDSEFQDLYDKLDDAVHPIKRTWHKVGDREYELTIE